MLTEAQLEELRSLPPADFVAAAMDIESRLLVELGVCDHGGHNWVTSRGGLPDMVNRIVKHLVEKGMACGHAIAVAINAVKKGGATGDVNWPGVQHMNAKSQAEYAGAAAHWETMKGGVG